VASLRKRGDKWFVEVSKNGQRKSKTFSTKAEATLWAAQTETEFAAGANAIPDKAIADMFERYLEEIAPQKKGYRWELLRLRLIASMPIGSVKLADFDERHVYAWRDLRKESVSEASVKREWEILSAVCTTAVREWKWLKINPFLNVSKPKGSKPRNRTYTQAEIDELLYALGYSEQSGLQTQSKRTGLAFLFALETAMRAGEICGLSWDRVFDKHVHLAETKNGHSRDVPLSKRAREILAKLPKDKPTCFNISVQNMDAVFRKAKAKTTVCDATFHDTRHTALTRLASKLDVMTLAKMSGHRDVRILLNVYYNPKMSDFADALG